MGAAKSKHAKVHDARFYERNHDSKDDDGKAGRSHTIAKLAPAQFRERIEDRHASSAVNQASLAGRMRSFGGRQSCQQEEQKHGSKVLSQIVSYMPIYCLEWMSQAAAQREELSVGSIEKTALVLFCDISGFSKMNEALDYGGNNENEIGLEEPSGAERVKETTSAFFERLISEITSAGGDIANVAGDALVAFFDINEKDWDLVAARVSSCIRGITEELNGYQIDEEHNVELGLHSCIAYGEVAINFVGGFNDKWLQVPIGSPIEECAEGVEWAKRGEVFATNAVAQALPEHHIDSRYESSKFVKLTRRDEGSVTPWGQWKTANEHNDRVASYVSVDGSDHMISLAQAFLPDTVVRVVEQGVPLISEVREATVLFLRAEPPTGSTLAVLNALHSVSRKVQEVVTVRSGMVKELTRDDKGLVCVVAFGVNETGAGMQETPAAAACKAARSLQEVMPAAGISTGTCFLGPLGIQQRCEYSLAGVTMVTAARLMMKAAKSTKEKAVILADQATVARASNELMFKYQGEVSVKGLREPVQVHKPRREGMQEKKSSRSRSKSLRSSEHGTDSSFRTSDFRTSDTDPSPILSSDTGENDAVIHGESSGNIFGDKRMPENAWSGWVETVDSCVQDTYENGRSHAVLVEGRPKFGKTSFLERCVNAMEANGFIVIAASFRHGGEPNDKGLHPSWWFILSDLLNRSGREVGIARFSQPFHMAQLVAGFRAGGASMPNQMEECVAISHEYFANSLASGLRHAMQEVSQHKPIALIVDSIHALSLEGLDALNMVLANQSARTIMMLASSKAASSSEKMKNRMQRLKGRCTYLELTGLPEHKIKSLLPTVLCQNGGTPISDAAAAFLAERSSGLLGAAALIAFSAVKHGFLAVRDGVLDIVDKASLGSTPVPKTVQAGMMEHTVSLPVRYLFYLRLASIMGTIDTCTAVAFSTLSPRSATTAEAEQALEDLHQAGFLVLLSTEISLCHLAFEETARYIGLCPAAEQERSRSRVFVVSGSLIQQALLRSMSNKQRKQIFAEIVNMMNMYMMQRLSDEDGTQRDEEWNAFVSKSQELDRYSNQVVRKAGTIKSPRARVAALVTLRMQLDKALDSKSGSSASEEARAGASIEFQEEVHVSREECKAVAVNDTVSRFGKHYFAGRSSDWLKGHIQLVPLFRAIELD